MSLIHTNVTVTKKDCDPQNIKYGFALWKNGSAERRMPRRTDGTYVPCLEAGFTKVSEHLPVDGLKISHNLAESLLNLPSVGKVDFNDFTNNAFYGTQVFAKSIVNGYKNIVSYSQAILDSCLRKTLRYTSLIAFLFTFDFTFQSNTINYFIL